MKNFVVTIICAAFIGAMAVSSPAIAQQKTVKACEDEWKANKEANQAKKITEKAYVEKCRAEGAAATTTTPAAPTQAKPSTTTAAPTAPTTTSKPTATTAPAPTASVTPTGANQYAAEAQAKARCPSATVVWANLDSKIYHFAGHNDYGHTKSGAYMCEQDATTQGMRAAKNEKHP
jgi:hypothetical protein